MELTKWSVKAGRAELFDRDIAANVIPVHGDVLSMLPLRKIGTMLIV